MQSWHLHLLQKLVPRARGDTWNHRAWDKEPWKHMSDGAFPGEAWPGHTQAWTHIPIHILGCSVQPVSCGTQNSCSSPITGALSRARVLVEVVSATENLLFDWGSLSKVGKVQVSNQHRQKTNKPSQTKTQTNEKPNQTKTPKTRPK